MKRRLISALLSALLFALGPALPLADGSRLVFFLSAYLLAGFDVLRRAIRQLAGGQWLSEYFLMSIATLGALALQEYAEAVAVMLFFQVGELFEAHALGKSRRSIAALMDLRPDQATLLAEEGPRQVPPEEVAVGQRILVRPGERLPLDGVILTGRSALDTAALTGESLPREAAPGDEAFSGTVNLSGTLVIQVTRPYAQSTVARILDLVENASDKKSRSEAFITRFSAVYTPIVVALALLLAFVPPLFFRGDLADWVYRALNFLVVSCPCALVISIPLAFFSGLGRASRQGILVKGSNYLEALARVDSVVFDKTGTLTEGRFHVTKVAAQGMPEEELLRIAAHAEAHSSHPLALAVRDAYGGGLDLTGLSDVRETAGRGVSAVFEGRAVLTGSASWLSDHGVRAPEADAGGSAIHIAVDGKYAGAIHLSDLTRPGAREALEALRQAGVRRMALLSGDSGPAARAVAGALGIREVRHGLLPQDKLRVVEEMLAAQPPGRKLAFVGDGINDAPVLARADVGWPWGPGIGRRHRGGGSGADGRQPAPSAPGYRHRQEDPARRPPERVFRHRGEGPGAAAERPWLGEPLGGGVRRCGGGGARHHQRHARPALSALPCAKKRPSRALFRIFPILPPACRAGGEDAAGPREEQVVPAAVPIHVQHFPGEVQPGDDAALHGGGIHIPAVDPAGGHLGVVKAADSGDRHWKCAEHPAHPGRPALPAAPAAAGAARPEARPPGAGAPPFPPARPAPGDSSLPRGRAPPARTAGAGGPAAARSQDRAWAGRPSPISPPHPGSAASRRRR